MADSQKSTQPVSHTTSIAGNLNSITTGSRGPVLFHK